MNEEQIDEMLAAGEQRGVEFKRGSPLSDSHLVAVVARAVLAMTNKRDGGRVVIGVEDNGTVSGISAADLGTWNPDHLRDKIAVYADPYVAFEMELTEFRGTPIAVLDVAEFEEIPVICKKAYDPVLREGAIYVRSRRKPESVPVSTQAEMRDLVDVATEKGIAKFNRQRESAGLTVSAFGPSDAELYAKELSNFLK